MPVESENQNRRWWDEVTPHHLNSRFYDVEGFLAGKNTLLPLELAALGDVAGKRLLHLQCHIALDTISWARLGARATGLDFSPEAVRAARDLARQTGMEGKVDFIECDVLEWHKQAKPEYDFVVSTYGTLCWLNRLEPWACGVAASLKPGGIFLLVDIHPIAESMTWDDPVTGRRGDYLGRPEGYCGEGPAPDYASAHAVPTGNRQWIWPVSTVIQSLLDAGLSLVKFEEHPFCCFEIIKGLLPEKDGYWHLKPESPQIPLLYTLVTKKL